MTKKVNRNDPCPCGSGEKYKKCCAKRDLARQQKRLSGLKGITAKPLGTSVMNTFAKKVFKVLSDTPASSSHLNKTVTCGPVVKTESTAKERGYQSLEELIGVEGAKNEDIRPQSLPTG